MITDPAQAANAQLAWFTRMVIAKSVKVRVKPAMKADHVRRARMAITWKTPFVSRARVRVKRVMARRIQKIASHAKLGIS